VKKIIIIGAGISGLFFANLLKQNSNYNVSIFEKKKSINLEHGYGIQLSTNSVKLLNEIGFKNLDSLTTFNPKNLDFYSLKEKKKICDLNISQFNTKDVKYTTLQRSTLIEFLEGRLTENIIKYGQVIKQVVKQKEMIKLTMEDNSMVLCDYLIICDGVFSSTKSLIANRTTKNKYFNSIALRGTINKKNFNSIDSKNISLFMGSNLHSVVYPIDKKSNEFNFITILKKDLTNNELDNYSLFSDSNFLSSILKELSNQIESNILENIKNIKAFPIYISSKIYEQKDEKIFIIGDAFFTFPPSFAQGASQSIEVAYDLYKMFENDRDEFLKKISIRVKKINRRSKFNNFTFHLSNRFVVFVRNILMRYLLKNKRFLNIYLGKIYNNDKFN
jgi:salicylate hydroxylase